MDENNIADNAVVETTTEGVANPTTEATQETTTQPENVVDITTTQAFSQRLKDSTQKAVDAEYSWLYGKEYGIHTKADYDKAIEQQKQAEEAKKLGIDPEAIKPFFETWKKNDPDFQELNNIRQANNIAKALSDANNEFKEHGIDLQLANLSDAEVAKIPNVYKVIEYVNKGYSLSDSIFLANKKDFISKQTQQAQQEAIRKISANGASSPGSLTTGIAEDNHITPEMFESKRNDPTWIRSNYEKIRKSQSKW